MNTFSFFLAGVFFLLCLVILWWSIFVFTHKDHGSVSISMRKQKGLLQIQVAFMLWSTIVFSIRPMYTDNIGDYIWENETYCKLYGRAQVLATCGNYLPVLFAYSKTTMYGEIFDYSYISRRHHTFLEILVLLGMTPIFFALVMTNAKPMTSNGLKICYEWDAPGIAFVFMYTIWMGITCYCIYIIFKKYEHGLEAIYSPQLRLHLWINKMIVPVLLLTSVVIMIISLLSCLLAYGIAPDVQSHRMNFELAAVDVFIFDYLINSFIMYYTLYGVVTQPIPDQNLTWIAFPGLPAVQIPQTCLEEHEYLRQYQIIDQMILHRLSSTESSVFQLSIPSHDRLMDYVMSSRRSPYSTSSMGGINQVEYDSDENVNDLFTTNHVTVNRLANLQPAVRGAAVQREINIRVSSV